ncbi:MAG: hypothetical protein IJZ44_07975 [Lachnospiraceae bacterium]|nr:hypothetical protein [Lachnospiraceae bacterium]
MKRIMLYISLVASALYILLVVITVAAQDNIKMQYGLRMETPFIVPVEDLILCAVLAMITIVLAILLMRIENVPRTTIEVVTLIVLMVVLVGSPFLENIVAIIWNMHYSMQGTEQLAAYSVIRSAMEWCRPILTFAQLLLITYAGISLGRKERV